MVESIIEFALNVCEVGNVVLTFEGRIGTLPRVGYHRGQWAMVTKTRQGHTAFSVKRENVAGIIEDSDEIGIHHGADDTAWIWFTDGGGAQTTKAHCMCGQFKWSSDTHTASRWAEKHSEKCSERTQEVEFPDDRTSNQ